MICRYGTPELIKRILNIYNDNSYDLECEDEREYKPIDYICLYSSIEVKNHILDIYNDRGYELEIKRYEKLIKYNSNVKGYKFIIL